MDLSKFKTSDWLKVGGAIGFLIFGFVHWASFHGFTGQNVFDYFFTGTIPWLLIIAHRRDHRAARRRRHEARERSLGLIMLAATGLAALLVVIRLLVGPSESGVDLDRGVGLWLCTIAALVVLAGAILGFRESGGEFSDLTDMNKLKGAFSTGGTSADAPPPPPPPPASPATARAPRPAAARSSGTDDGGRRRAAAPTPTERLTSFVPGRDPVATAGSLPGPRPGPARRRRVGGDELSKWPRAGLRPADRELPR